jgi:hypothetical protein
LSSSRVERDTLLREEDELYELLREERCAATGSTVQMVSMTTAKAAKKDINNGLRRLNFMIVRGATAPLSFYR